MKWQQSEHHRERALDTCADYCRDRLGFGVRRGRILGWPAIGCPASELRVSFDEAVREGRLFTKAEDFYWTRVLHAEKIYLRASKVVRDIRLMERQLFKRNES